MPFHDNFVDGIGDFYIICRRSKTRFFIIKDAIAFYQAVVVFYFGISLQTRYVFLGIVKAVFSIYFIVFSVDC